MVGNQKESPYGDPYALALYQHVTEYCDKIAEQPRDATLLLSPTDLEYLNFNLMLQKAFKILHESSSVEEPIFSLSLMRKLQSWAQSDRAKSWRILIFR